MPSPRAVIEDIRRTKYGIGLAPGSPERVGFDALRPVLDAAIEHLSDDLYADDIHFVLELVQNADDNPYRDGDETYLRFVRGPDRLLVQNNEAGFEEANVRALCSIGQSSKKKSAGYIGEKGIGFKSVFRVSDEPHVFSNGYRFRFRRRDPDTRLGFVVPEWVDETPGFVDPAVTNILLPLRPDLPDGVFRGRWFGPTLLLFLKRLKSIEYVDEVEGTGWLYRRVGDGDAVELHSGPEVRRWRLARTPAAVPAAVREEKREGVTHSEVVLAFPLDGEGGADAGGEQEVHAYLPVLGYGFRFVVQADFILSSSREAVLADRPWNLWLRDQIAPLFVSAVTAFRHSAGRPRTTFLRYVPEGPLAGLFGPVSDRIHAALREADCILTAAGGWAMPGRVVRAVGAVRAVMSDADVQQLLGRQYTAAEFEVSPPILRVLGVLELGTPDLLRCLQQAQWLAGKPDGWFAVLFAYLSTLDLTQDLDGLKNLRIVPMEDGTLSSVADRRGRVFLPLPRETDYGFEGKLPLVRKAVFEQADDPTRAAARRFLRTLGVKTADPPDLIDGYILPLFESDEAGGTWKTTAHGVLVGAVEYIKDHIEEYTKAGHDPAHLTKGLYLKIVHPENRFYEKPDALYLGRAYGNPNGLEVLFEGVEGARFVDPVYVERGLERLARRWKKPLDSDAVQRRRDREAKGWNAFFRGIGLVETPRVVREPTPADPDQASCPDLEKLFRTGDGSRIGRTVRLLDQHWSYYRPHLVTEVRRWERGRYVPAGHRRTKFGTLLADHAWLADEGGTPRRPSELFLDTPGTREVLGDDVPYLGAEFRDPRVADDLGIPKGPTVGAALARLQELSARPVAEIGAVSRLYRFLDQHFDAHAAGMVAAFAAHPLCLASIAPVRFLRSREVFWNDPGPAFLGRRGFLSDRWPGLKPFFVQRVGVRPGPSPEDFAAMLRELADVDELALPQERAVGAIYRELDRCLGAADDPAEVAGQPWWRELMRAAVFRTGRDEWWRNDGDLFVHDHDEFHRLYESHEAVAFLKWPAHRHPQISRFLKAAGIPLLSAAVTIGHVDPNGLTVHPRLTARCRAVVTYILRYLFHRENEVYRRLEVAGDLAKLAGLSVRTCDDLEVEVSLCGLRARVRQRFTSRLPDIIVAVDARDDLDGLGGELAKMIDDSDGLGMFVAAVLAKGDPVAVERFMRARGIPELPPSGGDGEGTFVAAGEVGEEPHGAAEATETSEESMGEEITHAGTSRSGEGDGGRVGSHASPGIPRGDRGEGGTSDGAAAPGMTDAPGRQEHYDEEHNAEPGTTDANPGATLSGPPRADGRPAGRPGRSRGSGVPNGLPRAADSDARGEDWAPQVPPRQAAVDMRDASPRPPAGPPRTFGERPPAESPTDSPDRGHDDEPGSGRNAQAARIGRWGEEHAVLAVEGDVTARHPGAKTVRDGGSLQLLVGGEVVAEVRWLNWRQDRGVGYDILVREGQVESYVEVKATADESRASFDVTTAEWECARLNGPRYRILRVYNAGRPAPRIEVITNPYQLWQEGRLVARPVRIEL